MSIKEWNNSIIFMHKILDGEADKSYGIHVAKLAGLPFSVTKKASQILNHLEKEKKNKNLKKIDKTQSSEINASENFFEEFDKIDINNISPLDSLNILNKLKLLRNSND